MSTTLLQSSNYLENCYDTTCLSMSISNVLIYSKAPNICEVFTILRVLIEGYTKLFGATGILYLITLIPCIFLNFVSNADLNPNEAEVAKQYPAHTAICIRDGWEFCSPELAAGMVLLETKDCLLTFSFYHHQE